MRSEKRQVAGTSTLQAVDLEHVRQLAIHGDRRQLPDGTGGTLRRLAADDVHEEIDQAAAIGRLTWRQLLAAEVAEADAQSNPHGLRVELVKVAAVAIAWIEALDERVA